MNPVNKIDIHYGKVKSKKLTVKLVTILTQNNNTCDLVNCQHINFQISCSLHNHYRTRAVEIGISVPVILWYRKNYKGRNVIIINVRKK